MLADKAAALRRAEQFVVEGNRNAAIAIYRGLIEADPLDLSSIQAFGDLYAGAGRTQEALHEMARLADRLIALGPAINAAPLLKKMLDLDPANVAAHLKLATVYARSGKREQAEQVFLEAGATFARKGNVVGAMDAIKRALAINPDSPQARAALKTLEGQTAPYVVQLPKADAAPTAPPRRRDTAELAELGQMLSAASVDFSANDVTNEFIVRQLFAAELLAGCDDVNKAIAVLKRILDYRPDAIDVRTKLSDIYLRSGMAREASQEFLEIARVYEGRGERVRAQDFKVRAERMRQHLGGPIVGQVAEAGGDQPQSARGDEIVAGSIEQMPVASLNPSAVVQAIAPAGETIMPPAPSRDAPAATLAPVAAVVKETNRREGHTTLGLFDVPATGAKRRPQFRRAVFYAVAATIVMTLLGGWFEARRRYAAEMDRAYQTLARVKTLPLPSPVVTAEQDALPRSEEQMDVRVGSATPAAPASEARAASQPAASDEGTPRDEAHKEQPAPAPSVSAKAGTEAAPNSTKAVAPPAVPTVLEPSTKAGSPPPRVAVSLPPGGSSDAPPPAASRAAAVIVKGEAIHRAQPDYPTRAREARQSGAVSVEVSVNERGEVVAAHALSGPALLRDPAVAAARRWKFKPATRDGEPIPSVSTITFNFKM